MKENPYDNEAFFQKYSQMDRSKGGLEKAGEWETLKQILPDFCGKRVLDLGCGYGWHCRYAIERGAASVVGIDISKKMLEVARSKTPYPQVEYRLGAIEDMDFPDESFDVVLSSLALHYVESFDSVARRVCGFLRPGGIFVFSVEHPVFTAYGTQDWVYDDRGNILYFPVDHYFEEGRRVARFLGETIVKYHKTLTTYLDGLMQNGFELRRVVEPQPSEAMLEAVPGMRDELRRPMMLIVSAQKRDGVR